MRPALIDDQLLSEVLRGSAGAKPRRREVFTTGCWYVRLCQAALSSGSPSGGVLSSPFAQLPDDLRGRAMRTLMELPQSVGLVSLRDLAPRIGSLRNEHSLNLLGIEALAAAKHLGADVFLSARSPRLEASLQREGLVVQVASP